MNKTKRKFQSIIQQKYRLASIRTHTHTRKNITLDENDIGYLIMKLQTTN